MKTFITSLLLAAVSTAADEKPADYDNLCLHCINSGFAFCSSDGSAGKCYDASCKEASLKNKAEIKAADGACTLEVSACDKSKFTLMTHYMQCVQPKADEAKCPSSVVISKTNILQGREILGNESSDLIQVSWAKKFTVAPHGSCLTKVELASDVPEDMIGRFEFTEWHDDIVAQMFRLNKGTALDTTNSALYSKESFNYSRENEDFGDIAGRVPVNSKQTYYMHLLNYDRNHEHSLVLEYGAAVRSIVFCTSGFVALLIASFV